jgi:serine/threonine protein kinase
MYRTRDPASPLVIVDFGIAKFIDNLTDADGAEGDEEDDAGDARGLNAGMGAGAGVGASTKSTPVFGAEEAASNMAGTFGYASPEALKGRRPACKMDMWSIGWVPLRCRWQEMAADRAGSFRIRS